VRISLTELIGGVPSVKPNRRCYIGGSDARVIMSADEAALILLWKEKRGEAEPADLSDNLVVQLGVATEGLNRAWYERNTGARHFRRPALGPAAGPSFLGGDPRRLRQRPRRRV
jgi:predicted phage-related endonuclease